MVSLPGEEGLADVVAGSIDLNGVKAEILHLFGALDEIFLNELDFFSGEVLGKGGSILWSGGCIKTAEGTAHAAQLIADISAGRVDTVDDSSDMGGLDRLLTAAREVLAEGQEVFDPDHLHTALGKRGIILNGFFLAASLGVGTGGGFHHAVVQGQTAELPGAENRGEIGIRVAEIVVLGIQFGHCLVDIDFFFRCAFCRCGHGAEECCCGETEGSGCGAFQKVSA